MWHRPRPGTKCSSPALAGEFLTTGPPGKSLGKDVETVKYCIVVGWNKELGQLVVCVQRTVLKR